MRWLLLLVCLCGCSIKSRQDFNAEGAKAEQLSINAEANPYSDGSLARQYWYEGYVESREKRWKAMGYDKD
jgi:hypothetical protein